ncbi:MAG: hypothetical protein MUF45_04820 [Spirosomaceae bacterium]|jgi:hypothetical protein|nr:hypothetical protein [Spirosomataceae bacterium]
MKTRQYIFKVIACFAWGMSLAHGQDIEKGIKDIKQFKLKTFLKEGLQVSGGISANHTYYQAWGIAGRQIPLNFLYTGNLNVSILNKLRMPVQFSLSNQDFKFNHPFNPNYRFAQPFNRLVLKPTYKSFTLHIGTCALNFSPYTLAAHRYNGFGFEYKPKQKAFYAGFMLGNLRRAALIDTSFTARNSQPSYKRMGLGIMLGLKKEAGVIELSIFSAKDQISSLPYSLDSKRIYPEANVATSLKVSKNLLKKWFLNAELAISGVTSDIRAGESSRKNTFIERYGGLLNVNSSTTYHKALRTGIDYKGKRFNSGIEYNRIDPEYRTLGAYYFVNNLENLTAKLSTQLADGKLAVSGNIGLQRDNLNKNQLQTLNRWVGMANLVYQPNDKANLNISYSNFTSYSNLRSSFDYLTQITPYDALDTLNFRQINQNITAIASFQLPSPSKDVAKTLSMNLIFQNGNDQQGSNQIGSKLYNISANYGHSLNSQKLTLAGAINVSKNQILELNNLMWGPSLTINKGFGDNLTTMLGVMYSSTMTQGKATNNILSGRLGMNYLIKSNHAFTLNVIYLDKHSLVTEPRQPVGIPPSFSELTATLGYVYKFTVKQIIKKKTSTNQKDQ